MPQLFNLLSSLSTPLTIINSLIPPPPPPPLSLKTLSPTNPKPLQLTITPNMNNQESQQQQQPLSICFPSSARANIYHYKSGYYNVQVVVGENEPEEVLLRRFNREVRNAGIIQECRRRMFFENNHDKKKRKARDAARRNRRRRYQPRDKWKREEPKEVKEEKKDDDDYDNWELPEGELPY